MNSQRTAGEKKSASAPGRPGAAGQSLPQEPQVHPVSGFVAVPTRGTLRKPCSQSKAREDIQISLCRKKSALWKFGLIT